jgi:hypothetical protein
MHPNGPKLWSPGWSDLTFVNYLIPRSINIESSESLFLRLSKCFLLFLHVRFLGKPPFIITTIVIIRH